MTAQLKAIAGGTRYAAARPGAPTSRDAYMMVTIAKLLTADDINSLAAYVQGLR